ncbi:MAG: hypothetical protein VX013_04690 [Pseudomonadota bacterium]|nr:hypothetical protein [Pseudomonadota bacterium]MEC8269484.1 hypothetical protein [Pseudomonadota bacterium]
MLWIDSLKQASARLRLTCSWAGFWLVRPRLLCRRLADARQLYRSRCELAELDAARRVDLGVTDDQVAAELSKPILGELSPWASLELRAAENDSRRGAGRSPRHERSFYRS